jgi:hypothetical protein
MSKLKNIPLIGFSFIIIISFFLLFRKNSSPEKVCSRYLESIIKQDNVSFKKLSDAYKKEIIVSELYIEELIGSGSIETITCQIFPNKKKASCRVCVEEFPNNCTGIRLRCDFWGKWYVEI